MNSGISPWRLGDWLINYEAGFIRRGLLGSLFFLAFENINQMFIGIYVLQLSCYFLILKYVMDKLRESDFSTYDLLLVFSPAFIFVFNLYDPQGGFRKEILVYAAYIFLLYWKSGEAKNKWLIILAFGIYLAAVFSHELASFFCIFFLRELWVAWNNKFIRRKNFYAYSGIFLLAGLTGICIGLLYPGNNTSYHEICRSLVARSMSPMTCSGAIEWLKFDASYGQKSVILYFNYYILNYPYALFLGLLPLLFGKWLTRNVVFAIISFLSIVPLFVVSVDWGRWINIYITMLSLGLLSENRRSVGGGGIFFLFGILLFSSSWSFRHCCSLGFEWGIWSR